MARLDTGHALSVDASTLHKTRCRVALQPAVSTLRTSGRHRHKRSERLDTNLGGHDLNIQGIKLCFKKKTACNIFITKT